MERLLLEFVVRTTLIAAVAGVTLEALRIRRASVQHTAWVCVILAMILLPVWLAWGPKASLPVLPARSVSPAADTGSVVLDVTPNAYLISAGPSPAAATPHVDWSLMLLGIYGLVTGALLLRLAVGTMQARRLTSADCATPVTVGLLRPRVVLPQSAAEWTPEQLAFVMAHEREHVRRRDPLARWLALLNRAVFWFHPLAWWLERRLALLAEEACDAAVIEQGHDACDYSLWLIELARSAKHNGARIDMVAMAMPGVYLPRRIMRLAFGLRAPRPSRRRLACAALVCAIPAALFAGATIERAPQFLPLWPLPLRPIPEPPSLLAQVAPSRPEPSPVTPTLARKLEFDAATVKPAAPFVPGNTQLRRGGPGTSEPERMNFRFTTMKLLLLTAYRMPFTQILGPSWIDDDKYDIVAKVPPGATKEQAILMLQNLLAERFKLMVHRETRLMQAYELTVAEIGPKIQPYSADDPRIAKLVNGMVVMNQISLPPPGEAYFEWGNDFRRMAVSRDTVDSLANRLALDLGSPVVNKTGLVGLYNYSLEYHPVPSPAGGLAPSPAQSGQDAGDLFAALTEQLGLKLEAKRSPIEVLVVDSGDETPLEN